MKKIVKRTTAGRLMFMEMPPPVCANCDGSQQKRDGQIRHAAASRLAEDRCQVPLRSLHYWTAACFILRSISSGDTSSIWVATVQVRPKGSCTVPESGRSETIELTVIAAVDGSTRKKVDNLF